MISAFRYFRLHITMRMNLAMDRKSSDSKLFLARENAVLKLMNNFKPVVQDISIVVD